MPTAPMWTGARLAAVGIAEGLGVSMTLLYARVRAATQLARYVRFTPNSGHWNSVAKCPLCAKSGHRPFTRSPRRHDSPALAAIAHIKWAGDIAVNACDPLPPSSR